MCLYRSKALVISDIWILYMKMQLQLRASPVTTFSCKEQDGGEITDDLLKYNL